MKKIYEKLAEIQQGLKAPKNLYNKFGQYYYRNAEGILEAVKPMLNGLTLIINDEPVMIGERFYIKATVTLTDGDESVCAVAYAREDETKKGMDGCQITGACSSYARKYALNALLMIDDSKDSDDDSLSPNNPDNKPDDNQGKRQAPKADVSNQPTVPPVRAINPNPEDGETPAGFIKRRMTEMTREFPGFDFMGARAALIKDGKVEDKPSATLSLEQARKLMTAVHDWHAKRAS